MSFLLAFGQSGSVRTEAPLEPATSSVQVGSRGPRPPKVRDWVGGVGWGGVGWGWVGLGWVGWVGKEARGLLAFHTESQPFASHLFDLRCAAEVDGFHYHKSLQPT